MPQRVRNADNDVASRVSVAATNLRSWSSVPPASRQLVMSPFTGKSGSSTMRMEAATPSIAVATVAACFWPGPSLSGRMTILRFRK